MDLQTVAVVLVIIAAFIANLVFNTPISNLIGIVVGLAYYFGDNYRVG
jgi:hypothetical protein